MVTSARSVRHKRRVRCIALDKVQILNLFTRCLSNINVKVKGRLNSYYNTCGPA